MSEIIGAASKCLRTLQMFTVSHPEWTLTDLSKELDISKSSMLNILKTLQSFNYLTKDSNQNYRLGLDILELSYHFRASIPILHYAVPIMEDIQGKTGQIIYLTVPKDGKILYLQSVNPGYRNISYSITGKTSYMHSSANGKAILSQFSDEDIKKIIIAHGLPKVTVNTITSESILGQQLDEIRSCGYAYDNCEDTPNVKSIAVPICTTEKVIGSIGISGSLNGMKDELYPLWADILSGAAEMLASYHMLFPFCNALPECEDSL